MAARRRAAGRLHRRLHAHADDIGHSFSCELTAEGEWTEESRSAYGTWQPVELRFTPLDDATAPGATNGYTVSFRNPSPVEATFEYLVVILPDGFRYRPQTTTGAITAEPTGATENIEWDGDGVKVPANGEITFSFGVTSGTAPAGHHYLRSYAYRGDSPVGFGDAWETARITIEAPFPVATCTVTGTAGDDVLTGTPGTTCICGGGGDDVLRGGDGDDVLFGGDGSDRLDGGEGDDTLLGGDGEDLLITGAGADAMRGGGGLDSVSYANRRAPVWVSLGESADDGEDGEGDDIDADVEIVRGGRSDDLLAGTPMDGGVLRRRGRRPDRLRGRRRPDRGRRRRRLDRVRLLRLPRPDLLRQRLRQLHGRRRGPRLGLRVHGVAPRARPAVSAVHSALVERLRQPLDQRRTQRSYFSRHSASASPAPVDERGVQRLHLGQDARELVHERQVERDDEDPHLPGQPVELARRRGAGRSWR